ncbi:MAG: hypothetical protein WBG18_25555 [Xanthobacteraceae bacterium]
MKVRFASGLFRLWVVFGVLWTAAVGAFTSASYQNAALPDLKGHQIIFDDLVPAYHGCWYHRTNNGEERIMLDPVDDKLLAQLAECERTADRWSIVKNGILIAFSIPIIGLVLGSAFVWAFKGFLPAKNT